MTNPRYLEQSSLPEGAVATGRPIETQIGPDQWGSVQAFTIPWLTECDHYDQSGAPIAPVRSVEVLLDL